MLANRFFMVFIIVFLTALAPVQKTQGAAQATIYCPALPAPTGEVTLVTSEADLRYQVQNAAAGSTLLVSPGVYLMEGFVHITVPGLVVRGATGAREDVTLDFGGMVGGYFGILVEADDVTLANLTIQNANDHGVSINYRDRITLYNLHILDTGDQLVKVNPGGNGSEDGLLACSRLEYTTSAPDDYTNGISAHQASRWVVRDNEWVRIRGSGGVTGPTILFWSGSVDTVVERNLLLDCYRGIAFGNAGHDGVDHSGGVVRNNMLSFNLPHDTGIEMVHAENWLVAFNTVLLLNPASGLTWGMEARYTESQGTFAYNLTNMSIWEDRDGASATAYGNLETASAGWFLNPASGNLHLYPTVTQAIDQAGALAQVTGDFDGQPRPVGNAADLGADEVLAVELYPQTYLPLARK